MHIFTCISSFENKNRLQQNKSKYHPKFVCSLLIYSKIQYDPNEHVRLLNSLPVHVQILFDENKQLTANFIHTSDGVPAGAKSITLRRMLFCVLSIDLEPTITESFKYSCS